MWLNILSLVTVEKVCHVVVQLWPFGMMAHILCTMWVICEVGKCLQLSLRASWFCILNSSHRFFNKGCLFSLLHQFDFNLPEIGWWNIVNMWYIFCCCLGCVECKDSCCSVFIFIHKITAVNFRSSCFYVYSWNKW